MPSSKKPRHKQRQRLVVIPIKPRDDWALEGRLLAAMVALDSGAANMDHMHEVGAHAILVRDMAKRKKDKDMARIANSVVLSVAAVFEKNYIGRIDAETIKIGVSLTLPWMRNQRNVDIARSSSELIHQ